MTRRGDWVSRALDIVVGGAVLMASLPGQASAAVGNHRWIGSPVPFRQPSGKGRLVFKLVAFRTLGPLDSTGHPA